MNPENPVTLSAVIDSRRIISVDVLRGVALLGILILNIQNFSMPVSAYINPEAYGDLSGVNKWVWILSQLFAREKFMSIFSLLFGAGILLFTGNALSKGRSAGPLHYRRMFWLLIFGMIHGYLIWSGDILVSYSLCGMLVFLFRKLRPGTLIWVGLLFFIVPVLFYTMGYFTMPYWSRESVENMMHTWKPAAEAIQKEIAAMQGNWAEQMEYRVPHTFFLQTSLFFMESFWRVMSMMLLGMALYKWNILNAERSWGFYFRMTILGLVIGFLLSSSGIILNFNFQWEMKYSMFLGKQFNYVGSVAVALGYTGIVMLICKSVRCVRFKAVTGAVGRMAFSNYILQTLICTAIFYGHGLALYGTVERKFQILIVFAIWIILLIISPVWLRYFRFGPLEWLWRSLTYRKWQPFRKFYLPLLLIGLFTFLQCHRPEAGISEFDAVSRVKSGHPVAVMLTSYSTTLPAGGKNHTRLRIALTDSLSREITSAGDSIRMYVEGTGKVANPDGSDPVILTDTSGRAYAACKLTNGICSLIFIPGNEPGKSEGGGPVGNTLARIS
jgi:uncharacterized protein